MLRRFPSVSSKNVPVGSGLLWSRLTRVRKEIGDIAIEVDCSMILVKEGEVDIGGSRLTLVNWAHG